MATNTEKIQEKLNKQFLIKASQRLIHLYKTKNSRILSDIFFRLFPHESEKDFKRIFYSLIKIYHPDSLETHLIKLKKAISGDSPDVLVFFDHMLSINMAASNTFSSARPMNYQHEESYEFDSNDYDLFSEDELDEADFQDDIIAIISSVFLGNKNRRLEPVDLAQIEGELVLSEWEISDLEGLQYCSNVRNLDLSHNQIDNIFEIKDLHQLEELDLSYNLIDNIDALIHLDSLETLYLDENQIEDISVLLKLPSLKLVSIVGNPLNSMDVIKQLQENGVVVLYY